MADRDAAGVSMPSALGGTFDLQDFHRGFTLDEITPGEHAALAVLPSTSALDGPTTSDGDSSDRPATSRRRSRLGKRFDLDGRIPRGQDATCSR